MKRKKDGGYEKTRGGLAGKQVDELRKIRYAVTDMSRTSMKFLDEVKLLRAAMETIAVGLADEEKPSEEKKEDKEEDEP